MPQDISPEILRKKSKKEVIEVFPKEIDEEFNNNEDLDKMIKQEAKDHKETCADASKKEKSLCLVEEEDVSKYGNNGVNKEDGGIKESKKNKGGEAKKGWESSEFTVYNSSDEKEEEDGKSGEEDMKDNSSDEVASEEE